MSGSQDQYDPSRMLQEWMKKGGKAQEEFMKMFASYLSQATGQGNQQQQEGFNPMQAFKDYAASAASQSGTNMAESISSMQQKAFESFMKFNQIMPNFLSWGSFKTNVGSNGRISIPEAEREALGIGEGDLVQVIVLPISRKAQKGADRGSGGYDDDDASMASGRARSSSGSTSSGRQRSKNKDNL